MQGKIRAVIVILLILLVVVIVWHRSERREQLDTALHELTLAVSEPLWNLNTAPLENYLEAVARRYHYQSLQIITDSGSSFHTITPPDSNGLENLFIKWGIMRDTEISRDIFHNETLLGQIVVVWRDRSIYFCSYAILIFLLLVVIAKLYGRVYGAKKDLEEKIQLIETSVTELQGQKDYIEEIFNVVPEGLLAIDKQKNAVENNRSFDTIIDSWAALLEQESSSFKATFLADLRSQLLKQDSGQYAMTIEGYTISIEYSSAPLHFHSIDRVVSLRDITKLTAIERQLTQSQKLEAVGRLASGIAHEINTPTQYVLTNIDFLEDAHGDVTKVMEKVVQLLRAGDGDLTDTALTELKQALEEADWEYLEEELPKALSQSKEGLRRIAGIVSAMKHFSHPSGDAAENNDINMAIKNTVEVARNEWKYVSEVDLSLDKELPLVPCYLDQINQVVLSMIVNSAHAIAEKNGENSGQNGHISIATRRDNDMAIISIRDDGIGIPENVCARVFDPFFTTKKLNKGTGQGLAIVYDVVVNRHKGTIAVESEPGQGTVFTLSLPLDVGPGDEEAS